jgi:glycosyltransferase involved in cell wall biosynthesis
MTRSVLLIGNYPPPYGGVPRYLENLAPFLAADGWVVHVVSTGRSGISRRAGVTVYKLPWPAKLPWLARHAAAVRRMPLGIRVRGRSDAAIAIWLRLQAALALQIVRRERVAVICGFNLSRGGVIGTAVGQEAGVPVVVSNFGELLSQDAFFLTNPGILPFICANAARLVSGSRHCASTYARFGLAPAVEVIPYGVDARRFRPEVDGGAIRARLGIAPGAVVALFLGRQIREMGLHTLLEAVPQMFGNAPRVHLLVAGASGELSAQARALAQAAGGRVSVMENVPLEELPAVYAAADLVVVPTAGDRACSSLAAAEALATGRPVVASAVGGIPEVVRDGDTGLLVRPGDPAALAAAVCRLADDASCRRGLGARGRAFIEAEWDTRRTLGRMATVLRETAERSR